VWSNNGYQRQSWYYTAEIIKTHLGNQEQTSVTETPSIASSSPYQRNIHRGDIMTTTKMIRAVEAIAYLLLAYSCNVAAIEYTASTAVKKAHAIYHIDYNLQLASNTDWGINTKNVSLKDNKYLQSIIVFPLIILSIGGIIIFSFLIFWTLRYCGCMCFADRPTNTLLLRNPLVWVKAVVIRKNVLLGFFSVFTFLTVAAVTISWYGFVLLRDNGTTVRDKLEETAVLFKAVKSAGNKQYFRVCYHLNELRKD
jgi:hypothetical protein